MVRQTTHPLVAAGSMLSGAGAVVREYLPMLIGFALTLLGLWLQRLENRRHERELRALRRPPLILPESLDPLDGKP